MDGFLPSMPTLNKLIFLKLSKNIFNNFKIRHLFPKVYIFRRKTNDIKVDMIKPYVAS